MNEMQWILLAFALVVVIAIYIVSQKRSSRPPRFQSNDDLKPVKSVKPKHSSPSDVESLVSDNEEERLQVTQHKPIDSDIELPADVPLTRDHSLSSQTDQPTVGFDDRQTQLELDADINEPMTIQSKDPVAQSPTHKVIEIDDMFPVENGLYSDQPQDGRQRHQSSPDQLEVPLDNSEPETFAILVLSTGDAFSIKAIDQVLKTNGLSFKADTGIFVKKVNDSTVLRVANIFEPGVFPAEWEDGATTAGIAIILQLPSHIKAPRAMDELILTARRVSQSLRGRMYDMERRMIRETDLQLMRERALDYESKRI